MMAALLLSSTLMVTTTHAAEENTVSQNKESQCKEEQTTSSSKSMDKETVTYNGQTMTLPVGPEEVKETKVTEKTQGEMGERAKQAAERSRTEVLKFTLGNTSVPRVDFIDVSSYQPNISVDTYKLMKSKGVKGVVVKLTEGTNYRNPYAKSQINNAKKAGLKVSTYHFARYKNKSQAEAEADYYAKYAKDLGLPSSTLMVNDMEAAECNNGYATSNSIYFALRLINKQGFKSVLHYGYQNWFDSGVLNVNKLGSDSIWCASYPYEPSKNNLWFKGKYEAWQFSSTMTVPGYTANTFDANIDYTGRFINKPKFNKLSNTYVTVDDKGKNVYKDTSLTFVKQSSSNLYHQTFLAKGYYNINGKRYYSIYNKADQWQGYISQDNIRQAGNHLKGGAHYTLNNTYGVSTRSSDKWSNFDFTANKGKTTIDDQYRVKGQYFHFNGNKYYSIYNKDDQWCGYVNANGMTLANNDFGAYHSYGKYVTVLKDGYGIYQDKNFKKKVKMSDDVKNKTFFAKGYYDRFNGTRYYSLYSKDGDGLKWEGYIRSTATKVGNSAGGAYCALNNTYGVATQSSDLWSNFDFTANKGKTTIDNQYRVKGQYFHFNGSKYYSIYNQDDQWCGYVNANEMNVSNNDFGVYHSYGQDVTVIKDGYGIYQDKNFKKKVKMSDDVKGKTFFAKGYYDRFNGTRYYSLCSKDGDSLKWEGYIRSTATKVETQTEEPSGETSGETSIA